jgi:hypothetical protein
MSLRAVVGVGAGPSSAGTAACGAVRPVSAAAATPRGEQKSRSPSGLRPRDPIPGPTRPCRPTQAPGTPSSTWRGRQRMRMSQATVVICMVRGVWRIVATRASCSLETRVAGAAVHGRRPAKGDRPMGPPYHGGPLRPEPCSSPIRGSRSRTREAACAQRDRNAIPAGCSPRGVRCRCGGRPVARRARSSGGGPRCPRSTVQPDGRTPTRGRRPPDPAGGLHPGSSGHGAGLGPCRRRRGPTWPCTRGRRGARRHPVLGGSHPCRRTPPRPFHGTGGRSPASHRRWKRVRRRWRAPSPAQTVGPA